MTPPPLPTQSDNVVAAAVQAAGAALRDYAGFDEVHDGATDLAAEAIFKFLMHMDDNYVGDMAIEQAVRYLKHDVDRCR